MARPLREKTFTRRAKKRGGLTLPALEVRYHPVVFAAEPLMALAAWLAAVCVVVIWIGTFGTPWMFEPIGKCELVLLTGLIAVNVLVSVIV